MVAGERGTRREVRVRLLVGAFCFAAFVGLGLLVRHVPGSLDRLLRDTVATRWQGELGTVAWLVSAVLGPILPVLLGVALLVVTVRSRRRGDLRAWVTLGVHWVTDTVGAVLAVAGVGLLAIPALRLLPAQHRNRSPVRDGVGRAGR